MQTKFKQNENWSERWVYLRGPGIMREIPSIVDMDDDPKEIAHEAFVELHEGGRAAEVGKKITENTTNSTQELNKLHDEIVNGLGERKKEVYHWSLRERIIFLSKLTGLNGKGDKLKTQIKELIQSEIDNESFENQLDQQVGDYEGSDATDYGLDTNTARRTIESAFEKSVVGLSPADRQTLEAFVIQQANEKDKNPAETLSTDWWITKKWKNLDLDLSEAEAQQIAQQIEAKAKELNEKAETGKKAAEQKKQDVESIIAGFNTEPELIGGAGKATELKEFAVAKAKELLTPPSGDQITAQNFQAKVAGYIESAETANALPTLARLIRGKVSELATPAFVDPLGITDSKAKGIVTKHYQESILIIANSTARKAAMQELALKINEIGGDKLTGAMAKELVTGSKQEIAASGAAVNRPADATNRERRNSQEANKAMISFGTVPGVPGARVAVDKMPLPKQASVQAMEILTNPVVVKEIDQLTNEAAELGLDRQVMKDTIAIVATKILQEESSGFFMGGDIIKSAKLKRKFDDFKKSFALMKNLPVKDSSFHLSNPNSNPKTWRKVKIDTLPAALGEMQTLSGRNDLFVKGGKIETKNLLVYLALNSAAEVQNQVRAFTDLLANESKEFAKAPVATETDKANVEKSLTALGVSEKSSEEAMQKITEAQAASPDGQIADLSAQLKNASGFAAFVIGFKLLFLVLGQYLKGTFAEKWLPATEAPKPATPKEEPKPAEKPEENQFEKAFKDFQAGVVGAYNKAVTAIGALANDAKEAASAKLNAALEARGVKFLEESRQNGRLFFSVETVEELKKTKVRELLENSSWWALRETTSQKNVLADVIKGLKPTDSEASMSVAAYLGKLSPSEQDLIRKKFGIAAATPATEPEKKN